jgi:4-amino-4-deoxy-L-arabinose transferase-like glycosyltransferase
MMSASNELPTVIAARARSAICSRPALLIVILLVAMLRLWRSPWSASDLAVIPDSVEYAVGAQRLATLGHYDIGIEGVAYPPRYPPWFSMLLWPAYVLAPDELGAGILVVFASALCAVAAAFVIGGRLAGEWGAVAAALALVCYGEFRRDATKIMTDVPALALALWACVVYLRMRSGEGRSAMWLFAGALCAAAFALRLELLAPCAPFGLLLLRGRSTERYVQSPSRSRAALASGLGVGFSWKRAALFASPVIAMMLASALYNQTTFGSWRRTGYQFWLPELHAEMSHLLSPHFIAANVAVLGSFGALTAIGFGIVGGWRLFRSREREVSVLESHSAPDTIPMDAHGVNPRSMQSASSSGAQVPSSSDARSLATFFVLGALPVTLFHLFYFYQDLRFHLFPLALLCIAAGAGMATLLDERARQRMRWALPWIALATIALPASSAPVPYRRIVAETLARETPSNAVIVSALEPVYLEPLLLRGSHRRVVPYARAVEYAGRRPEIEWLSASRVARSSGAMSSPHHARDSVAPGRSLVCELTADEDSRRIAEWVRSGVPVVLDASFLLDDFPRERLLDTELEFEPSDEHAWLSHFVLRR